MVDGDDQGRRPRLLHAALPDQFRLQEAAKRRGLESHILLGPLVSPRNIVTWRAGRHPQRWSDRRQAFVRRTTGVLQVKVPIRADLYRGVLTCPCVMKRG